MQHSLAPCSEEADCRAGARRRPPDCRSREDRDSPLVLTGRSNSIIAPVNSLRLSILSLDALLPCNSEAPRLYRQEADTTRQCFRDVCSYRISWLAEKPPGRRLSDRELARTYPGYRKHMRFDRACFPELEDCHRRPPVLVPYPKIELR